jgi:(4-(4-[2-(gamma-L-glutamylamino)ethyl]phenoxymethyl)furan-2-yl)methanamine synthase
MQRLIGWDIGGAHVKACLVEGDRVRDIAQWPCPLWQGLAQLDAAIAAAQRRWPQAADAATAHAATMTGEMVDLFAHREAGVLQLADTLARALGPGLRFYAMSETPGRRWVAASAVASRWHDIASANWRATAELVAARLEGDAVLLDVGSTTTDIIAIRAGRVAARGASDAQRLATGELVYHGVVRTPLCALAQRVPFGGDVVNVMNEFFATTADVYRLCGELDADHDQQASADGGAKDAASTRQRLARMIGRDARDARDADWLTLARHWREAQLAQLAGQMARVAEASGVAATAPVVAAGCGAFVALELAQRSGRRGLRLGGDVLGFSVDDHALARWAEVCAPAVAVALLASQA